MSKKLSRNAKNIVIPKNFCLSYDQGNSQTNNHASAIMKTRLANQEHK